jgi:hypothetical protein
LVFEIFGIDIPSSPVFALFMQLRDHPLMSYGGVRNWPPVWTKGSKESDQVTVRSEIGILKYVHFNRLPVNKCYLVIEYRDENLVGTLIFSDALFCAQIAEFLRHHVGQTIKEIGDLEISSML